MRLPNTLVLTVEAVLLAAVWIARQSAAPLPGQPPVERQPPANVSSVTQQQFDQWMTQLSNGGRWGKDDQLGTLNLITPEKRRRAAALVKTGTAVSLSSDIARVGQQQSRPNGGWLVNRFRINGEFLMESQETEFHGSRITHFDAVCHRTYKGKGYNGLEFKDVATEDGGCSKLAVTTARNSIITRGVLVDIPGTTRLRREDIDAWEKRTGIKISSGDALLFRTRQPNVTATGAGAAGYDPSILPFLKERDVALIGSDAIQEGGNIPGVGTPIHAFVLVALGMNILDNLDLTEAAETASKLRRWDFMLVVSPLRVEDGSGSPVNPVALF